MSPARFEDDPGPPPSALTHVKWMVALVGWWALLLGLEQAGCVDLEEASFMPAPRGRALLRSALSADMAGVEGSLSIRMGCPLDLSRSLPVEASRPPYSAVLCRRSLELPDPGESSGGGARRGPRRRARSGRVHRR